MVNMKWLGIEFWEYIFCKLCDFEECSHSTECMFVMLLFGQSIFCQNCSRFKITWQILWSWWSFRIGDPLLLNLSISHNAYFYVMLSGYICKSISDTNSQQAPDVYIPVFYLICIPFMPHIHSPLSQSPCLRF